MHHQKDISQPQREVRLTVACTRSNATRRSAREIMSASISLAAVPRSEVFERLAFFTWAASASAAALARALDYMALVNGDGRGVGN